MPTCHPAWRTIEVSAMAPPPQAQIRCRLAGGLLSSPDPDGADPTLEDAEELFNRGNSHDYYSLVVMSPP